MSNARLQAFEIYQLEIQAPVDQVHGAAVGDLIAELLPVFLSVQ